MDLGSFAMFNRGNIQDRQTDTLIGLSKGIIADNVINQEEINFLITWLMQNVRVMSNPILENLLSKLDSILTDNVIDQDEAKEIFSILKKLAGDETQLDEIPKSSKIPLDDPEPKIYFPERKFLFTGTLAYGTRKEAEKEITKRGGILLSNVTQKLNYLIIGEYVQESWAHENFGRKIEKAMEYRDEKQLPIAIVSEEHWLRESGLLK